MVGSRVAFRHRIIEKFSLGQLSKIKAISIYYEAYSIFKTIALQGASAIVVPVCQNTIRYHRCVCMVNSFDLR